MGGWWVIYWLMAGGAREGLGGVGFGVWGLPNFTLL